MKLIYPNQGMLLPALNVIITPRNLMTRKKRFLNAVTVTKPWKKAEIGLNPAWTATTLEISKTQKYPKNPMPCMHSASNAIKKPAQAP